MKAQIPLKNHTQIIGEVTQSLHQRVASGVFTLQDVHNIQHRKMELLPEDLSLSSEQLNKLRRLCQCWEVDIRVGHITSHRPIIGPIIVRIKKILFPIIRFALKDLIREQRDFNAATISLLSDLCNESARRNR